MPVEVYTHVNTETTSITNLLVYVMYYIECENSTQYEIVRMLWKTFFSQINLHGIER